MNSIDTFFDEIAQKHFSEDESVKSYCREVSEWLKKEM